MKGEKICRREFLIKSGMAAVAATAFPTILSAQSEKRVNVVLILADDFGYECVGANGGTSYRTPVLDGMAKRGVSFEHCHSLPLCTPSRVQLMTGMSNKHNYIQFGTMSPKAKTLGNIFKDAGYATGILGKWQLGTKANLPRHFGFDESCLYHYTRKAERYRNPGLDINGKSVDYQNGEYGPDIVSKFACKFIERHREDPFFLYYPLILTHDPFQPTPDSADWNAASPVTAPASSASKPASKPKPASNAKYFADMVEYMDKLIGELLDAIEKAGVADRTLIIFTGDNGTHKDVTSMLNGVKFRGGKRYTIDAGTHVPLIAIWPGQAQEGDVCGDLIDFTDFLPTICEAAGIALPHDNRIDGVSFLPQIRGEAGNPRQAIFSWYLNQGQDPADAAEFARDKRFKLYKNGGDKRINANASDPVPPRTGQMFDVINDPQETIPLLPENDTPEMKAARDKLESLIKKYDSVQTVAVRPSRSNEE